MRVDLQKLLMEHCSANPTMVKEETVDGCVLSITQIRDKLYLLGNILYEDLDNKVYVASVRAGFANMNAAIIALQLQGGKLFIVGYAKEGLIKQKICESAIQKISDIAQGKAAPVPSKYSKLLPLILVVIGISAFVAIRGCILNRDSLDLMNDATCPTASNTEASKATEPTEDPAFAAEVQLTIDATKAYNEAANRFNQLVSEYNEAVGLICIDNINGMPTSLETLSLESESYEDNAEVVRGENSKEKIAADTKLIGDMCQEVAGLIKIAKQLNAPSGDWVSERLAGVEGITGCQQVTEEQNPDGLLGKEGGYSACVYFSHKAITQSEVPGVSIVEKGTDAGGAVEIYATLADAQARVEYLAGFDGTILYSGSYAIVGTMVIRTSYKLTDEQQLILTHTITQALTTVVESNT